MPPISPSRSPSWRSRAASPTPGPTEDGGNRDCPGFYPRHPPQRIHTLKPRSLPILHGAAFWCCPVISLRFVPCRAWTSVTQRPRGREKRQDNRPAARPLQTGVFAIACPATVSCARHRERSVRRRALVISLARFSQEGEMCSFACIESTDERGACWGDRPFSSSLFPNAQGSCRIIGVGFRKGPVSLLQRRAFWSAQHRQTRRQTDYVPRAGQGVRACIWLFDYPDRKVDVPCPRILGGRDSKPPR